LLCLFRQSALPLAGADVVIECSAQAKSEKLSTPNCAVNTHDTSQRQLLQVPEIHRAHRPRWLASLCRMLLRCLGWRIIGEFPSDPRLVLVAGPHTSNWDFLVGMTAMLALDLRIHWVGKHTLFFKPFGGFMNWLGGIPVNRSAPEGFAEQIARRIRGGEQAVIAITPEGTRKKVAKLKTGFSRIARETPCPILPVTLDYGSKQIRLYPVRDAGADSEADAVEVRRLFATVVAKVPARF